MLPERIRPPDSDEGAAFVILTPTEEKGADIPDAQLLRAALHALGEGVSLADESGRILYSNPAADRILGVSATSAPPEEWAEHYGVFLPDGETPFPADEYPLVLATEGRSTDDVEMFVRNEAIPDGALISVTGRPLRNSHGEIVGAVVVFRDITRLRRIEQQKRELTGFLVHDMKSPLTSILANADLVLGSDSSDDLDRESLIDLRGSAETLHRMVLNLLDIQTAEDGRLDPELASVPVVGAFEDVVGAVSGRAAGVTIRIPAGAKGPIPPLRADPELLRRILTNLVDNCLKYGPADGTIWLDARRRDEDTILLTVADEGPGVPPELREAIFERYAKVERDEGRRDPSSRGLGLRFCRLAVEGHGGRIWVEDNEPAGARFCVELPVA